MAHRRGKTSMNQASHSRPAARTVGDRPKRAPRVLACAFALAAAVFSGPAIAQEPVVLRLNWDHQSEFAGYYAALWQGFYRDAGLEVEILSLFESGDRVMPIEEVVAGRADFGIGSSNVLVAIDGGAPLVIASPVFQHSGFGVVSRPGSGIFSPSDLAGSRVSIPTSDYTMAEFMAVLSAEGVEVDSIEWVEVGPGEAPALLDDGRIDAFFTFIPASLFEMDRRGIPVTVLTPAAYGVDFYGSAIFTSAALAQSNPDLVSRFVAASLDGWRYALAHPNEIADRVTEELTRRLPRDNLREYNRQLANRLQGLTLSPMVQLGASNPERWQQMHQVLAAAGLVSEPFDYFSIVFDPDAKAARTARVFARFLAAALSVTLGLVLVMTLWTWSLRRTVRARTSELMDRDRALSESDQRHGLVLDGTGAGIWDWTVETGEVFVSRRFCELLGYAEGDLPPKVEKFFDLVHPEDQTAVKDAMRRHLDNNERYEFDTRLRHKDGHFIWFHTNGQAIWNATGEPQRMAGSIIDVTDRVESNLALRAAKELAEAANYAKSEFLASMSHELRTPLNAILGFGQALDDGIYQELEPRQKTGVSHILSSGRHLLALIDDVLDLAQLDSRGLSVDLKRINPSSVIRGAAATARQLAVDAGIDFKDLTPGLEMPDIESDPTRLHQVLLNLLSNGLKYNHPGGALSLTAKETENRFLRIIVSDTGPGIAEERQKDLFEPFSRLGQEKTNIAGTGIGLTITKRLTEAMRGRIAFRSTLGLGSEFWVEFPIVGGSLSTRPLGADAAGQLLDEMMILCVEDNPQGNQMMQALIDSMPGVSMITARTGEVCLDLAERRRPNLILMDVKLPGMDGVAARNALKNSPRTSSIPVIAITANASKEEIATGLAAGFEYYFTMPWDVSEVMGAINDLLERP